MIQISEARIQTLCLLFLSALAAGFAAYVLRPVLLPFVVAVFVVSGVSPILEFLQRSVASSRLTAAAIAFIIGSFIVVVLMTALWASVVDLASHADEYEDQVEVLVQEVKDRLPWISQTEKGNATPRKLESFLEQLVKQGAGRLSHVFLELFSTSVIVLIYIFFLLMGAPKWTAESQVWRDVDYQIRTYLSLKTVISLVTGAAFGFALWVHGVPMAMVFGMLAFLLNFIPNVGPLIASVLPLPLIIFHPEASLLWMVSVISITSGIQFVSGNVIEPRIMGESSDMHPIVVLLALMFWGMLWGIVGMFLATPITAGIRIGLSQFEVTQPIAELMAGRMPQKNAPEEDPSMA